MTSLISQFLRHSARPIPLAAVAVTACAVLVGTVPASALAATSRTPTSPSPPGQNSAVAPHMRNSASLGDFVPSFTCEKPGLSHTITVIVDLSDLHITAHYRNHELKFDMTASPKFSIVVDFKGKVECKGVVQATVPLGETGLDLKIGPAVTFDADGGVAADFTWQPTFQFGFTLDRHGFTNEKKSLTNGGGIDVTGKGSASMSLGLDATVETAGGLAGLEGFIGPVLTVKVTAHAATRTSCWTGTLAGEADLKAFVKVFKFLHAEVKYSKEFDSRTLAGNCTDIIFDGRPGTSAPPSKLGPYAMKKFPSDPTPAGTSESQISGPTGKVKFDGSLTHDLIGDGWATWSNGYSGDVYVSTKKLHDGNFEVTVTLPADTGAFYAYAEPNLFKDFDMSASAQDGPSSGDLTVLGNSGARYFGFYATCGHSIKSITYVDSGRDTAMAVGEFGIAPASACHGAHR